jgi:hypothetical protein
LFQLSQLLQSVFIIILEPIVEPLNVAEEEQCAEKHAEERDAQEQHLS